MAPRRRVPDIITYYAVLALRWAPDVSSLIVALGTFTPPAAARRRHAGMSSGALKHQPSDGANRAGAICSDCRPRAGVPGDGYPATPSDVTMTREDSTPRERRCRRPRRLRVDIFLVILIRDLTKLRTTTAFRPSCSRS